MPESHESQLRLQAGCDHMIVDAFREKCLACAGHVGKEGLWVVQVREPWMDHHEVHLAHVMGGIAYGFCDSDGFNAESLTFVRRIEVPETDPDGQKNGPVGNQAEPGAHR